MRSDQVRQNTDVPDTKTPTEVHDDIVEHESSNVVMIELQQIQPFVDGHDHRLCIRVAHPVVNVIQELEPDVALFRIPVENLTEVDRMQSLVVDLLEYLGISRFFGAMCAVIKHHGGLGITITQIVQESFGEIVTRFENRTADHLADVVLQGNLRNVDPECTDFVDIGFTDGHDILQVVLLCLVDHQIRCIVVQIHPEQTNIVLVNRRFFLVDHILVFRRIVVVFGTFLTLDALGNTGIVDVVQEQCLVDRCIQRLFVHGIEIAIPQNTNGFFLLFVPFGDVAENDLLLLFHGIGVDLLAGDDMACLLVYVGNRIQRESVLGNGVDAIQQIVYARTTRLFYEEITDFVVTVGRRSITALVFRLCLDLIQHVIFFDDILVHFRIVRERTHVDLGEGTDTRILFALSHLHD